MIYQFSRQRLTGRAARLQRLCEILPGAASWTLLIGIVCLSYWRPLTAAMLVIAFVLYWLLRLFYMLFFLMLAYLRLAVERRTDWMARVHGIDRLPAYLEALRRARPMLSPARRLSRWLHRRELSVLQRSQPPPPSDEIYHLVIVPVAKERREVIEPGIASLARQQFPTRRILVILALEARAAADVKAGAQQVQARHRDAFLECVVVEHPDGLPGEARVKGANVTWAARAAARMFDERRIAHERVIVSCFDADTVVSEHYFSCLTYAFLCCPRRTRASFQPIPVYHNNIWQVPGFARVLDIGSSFFQLVEATNPEKLVTFSSHSMSFQALVDVGYWPVDMISDDSAIFWKAFIHFDGDYRVVPMYVTVSMDVVDAGSWWRTIAHVYKQKRRWAWGVENLPLVTRAFLRARKIPRYDRLRLWFKLFEGHLAWATWPFLLTLIGWLPALLAWREFSSTVLYYSTPRITATIFGLASLSLAVTIALSFCLLPKSPVRQSWRQRIGHACEWLLVPVISLCFSALPALDAQTRLMLGRHMEFWVTDKHRDYRTRLSADA